MCYMESFIAVLKKHTELIYLFMLTATAVRQNTATSEGLIPNVTIFLKKGDGYVCSSVLEK